MKPAEYKEIIDSKIVNCGVINWRREEQDRLYEILHLAGCRIEGINARIDKNIREFCKEQGT